MPKKRIDILQGVLGAVIVIIAIRIVILIALDITPLADYCFKKYENQQYNEYIYAEGKINEYVLNEISELITQGNMPKALVYYFYKDGGIPLWFCEKKRKVAELVEDGMNIFIDLKEQVGQTVANIVVIVAGMIIVAIIIFVLYMLWWFISNKISDCITNGAELFKTSVQVSTFFAFYPLSVHLYEMGIPWLNTSLLPLWGVLGALAVVLVTLCIKSCYRA